MKKLKVVTMLKPNEIQNIIASAKRTLKTESDSVAALIDRVDGNFAYVVDLIDRCSSHLIVTGMGKSGIVDVKEFYGLFPGAPLKKATKIAGVPKPTSCI